MKVTLNGRAREMDGSVPLKDFITQLAQDPSRLIVEVNGRIVKEPQWADVFIKDGDRIELLALVGGG